MFLIGKPSVIFASKDEAYRSEASFFDCSTPRLLALPASDGLSKKDKQSSLFFYDASDKEKVLQY
jgi:hypothetical protein